MTQVRSGLLWVSVSLITTEHTSATAHRQRALHRVHSKSTGVAMGTRVREWGADVGKCFAQGSSRRHVGICGGSADRPPVASETGARPLSPESLLSHLHPGEGV